jgi:hypothetical protein
MMTNNAATGDNKDQHKAQEHLMAQESSTPRLSRQVVSHYITIKFF